MASRASVTVSPATCTTPYCRRLIVPSGPTRYWPVNGCAPDTRASLHGDLRLADDLAELGLDGLLRLVQGHAHHADAAVGRPQVHHPFGLDHVIVVDRLVGQGIGDVDLRGRRRLRPDRGAKAPVVGMSMLTMSGGSMR